MFCKNCGNQLSDRSKFCNKCGSNVNSDFFQQGQHINKQQNFSSQFINLPPKKKSGCLKVLGIGFGVVFGLLLIFMVIGLFLKNEEPMKLGNSVSIATAEVPATGGIVKVEGSSSISGLTIDVPDGAYASEKSFKISTSDIIEHNLGKYFNPITPLITIDNGHTFANDYMTVTIPIQKAEDEFALAFYYDRDTNKLEALPFSSVSHDNIQVFTSHFSDVVVSKIKLAELDSMSLSPDQKIDTGFKPGVDDWQFTNYGSYLAPKGHCGGQAISMTWYYSKQYKEKGAPRLYGRFDNNAAKVKTPDFWFDDSQGYRFASVLQSSIDWSENSRLLKVNSELRNQDGYDDKPIFDAFAYAMLMTGEPQLMAIYKWENFKRTEGHAITAYKIENGKIYVADPNYPGKSDRYVGINLEVEEPIIEYDLENPFDNEEGTIISERREYMSFDFYSSGANALDIKDKGATIYNNINFIGQSAIVDYAGIDKEYQKMLNGSAGNDKMPAYTVSYLSAVDQKDPSKRTYTPIGETLSLKKGYDASFPKELKGKLSLRVDPGNEALELDVYTGLSSPVKQNEKVLKPGSDAKIMVDVNLKEGENQIGILLNGIPKGQKLSRYVDFKWIKVDYSGNEPEETPVSVESGNFTLDKYGFTTTSLSGGSENTHGVTMLKLNQNTVEYHQVSDKSIIADRLVFTIEKHNPNNPNNPYYLYADTEPSWNVSFDGSNTLTITINAALADDYKEVFGAQYGSGNIAFLAQGKPDIKISSSGNSVTYTVKTNGKVGFKVGFLGDKTSENFYVDILKER